MDLTSNVMQKIIRRMLTPDPPPYWEKDPAFTAWVNSLPCFPRRLLVPKRFKLPRKLKRAVKKQILRYLCSRLAVAMAMPIRQRLNYTSIARQIFLVEPMPDGAPPIYDLQEGHDAK